MASAFTHAVSGLAIGTAFPRRLRSSRFWLFGAGSAAIPDLDVIGYRFGVPYDSVFGDRGFTHSLIFAALFSGLCLFAFRRDFAGERRLVWLYLFLATASHGILDAMTSGGGGVAFFAPLVNERYFFPWRPILVSPLDPRRFFTSRGLAILANELVWVWTPCIAFAAVTSALRRPATARDARNTTR